jgi:transposase
MMAAFEAGLSRRAVALRFDVSPSCMVKLVQHRQRTGSLQPRTATRRKPYALAAHEKLVRQLLAAQPDVTLDELQAALAGEGVVVGRSSVNRYLKALNLTLKKSRSALPNRIVRTSPRPGRPGTAARPGLTRRSWSSSTKPG